MKNKTFKKSISLIMTVLMIMSCWVFFPGMIPEASADGSADYISNLINGLNTSVNTSTTPVYGRFNFYGNGDKDDVFNRNKASSFVNVLYSPKVTDRNDPAADFEMSSSQNADSVKVFYPDTILKYDGITDPKMGVLLSADAYNKKSLRCVSCWISENNNGLVFSSKEGGNPWIGKAEEDSCFYYTYYDANEPKFRVSTDGQNTGVKCGTKDGKWTFFANHLVFDATMGETEWVRIIKPKWTFMGGTSDGNTYSADSKKSIYVVNFKAYADLVAAITNKK